jgi:hypothetical protein
MQNKIELQNKSFEIFQRSSVYNAPEKLFFSYFDAIPNIKIISEIEQIEIQKMIESEYKPYISKTHFEKVWIKNKLHYENTRYVLKNNIIIAFTFDDICILFEPDNELFVNKILERIFSFTKKESRTKAISLVVAKQSTIGTKEILLKKPNLKIELHYNEDFKVVHQKVLKELRKENSKGLFLFYGSPGTGKSTYIKYLMHQQRKKVIFISPKMAGNLDSMVFTEFLIANTNSILVIEDAEELIVSRENNKNLHLSFLLNLTDGILADSLGIQIIATFNTNIQNIDKALLRKGRLTAIYEFKELEFQKVNTLFKHLKIENQEVLKSMSLADIFNFEADNFVENKEKVKIGF